MPGVKNNKKVETKIVNDIHYRKCTACEQWLTLDNYYSNCKHDAYWIDSNCKDCRKKKSIKRQQEKRKEIIQQRRDKKLEERGIQSPFNYLANKYLLLPQIAPLLSEDTNRFVDLFCGSATVGINSGAKSIICNDIDNNMINFFNKCKELTSEEAVQIIKETIINTEIESGEEAFIKLRDEFNNGNNNWNIFYVLVTYSFNQHPLYNKKGLYTTAYGKGKCHFNFILEKRLGEFINAIKNMDITFMNRDFKTLDFDDLSEGDFLYADPPYLISSKTYEWNLDDEIAILQLLDDLDAKRVKFALSNILKHKKGMNDLLIRWSKKYNIHRLQRNYSRLSRGSLKNTNTTEVLITNY